MGLNNSLVFFGNERLGTGLTTTAPVLQALLKDGYDIAAIIIAQNVTAGSRKDRPLEIAKIANENSIPLLSPQKLISIKDQIASYGASAGVLIAYGKMVPTDIINLFPNGIINIHPSLLPKYRGPTPIESVILNGDLETGVTLMQLAQKMDAGPILAQETVKLTGTESKQDLANTLLERGKDMLLGSLPAILSGSVEPKPQDDTLATYNNLINKSDGILDFNKPAVHLEREIRAYAEWPRSRTAFSDITVIINKASVIDEQLQSGELIITQDKKLLIGTRLGSLEILELMPLGKQKMTAQAFLNGYGNRIS